MECQTIHASSPQAAFWKPPQGGLEFPLSLAEKYQPRNPKDFVGLARPKELLRKLLLKPRACGLAFIGSPGTGKSVMATAISDSLPGSLHVVSAQKCDVATLDSLNDKFSYMPPVGNWWVCVVEEADQMTEKAQLQLLSRLDGTAALRPTWGGGYMRGTPPPIIWVFTANGRGPDHTLPPSGFESRFLSRCMIVPFHAPTNEELAPYLAHVWKCEGGPRTPKGYFDYIGDGLSVRDALQRLDTDLLAGCRPRPQIEKVPDLAESLQASIDERSSAAVKAWETRRERQFA